MTDGCEEADQGTAEVREREEANWWFDNRDLVETEFLQAEGEGRLRRGTAMRQAQEAAARKHALTVHVSAGDLAKIRGLAAERGPVVVVSSDPAANESARSLRDGAAARLDFLSSNTVHITAKGSGHEVHLYRLEVVVRALPRTVAAVRSGTPVSHL